MARIRNGCNRVGDDGGIVIEGIYEKLATSIYRGVDPRVFVTPDGQCEEVQAAKAVHSPLMDRFDQGLPVQVARWQVANRALRQQHPWLAGVGTVVVTPEDRVYPTDLPADGM